MRQDTISEGSLENSGWSEAWQEFFFFESRQQEKDKEKEICTERSLWQFLLHLHGNLARCPPPILMKLKYVKKYTKKWDTCFFYRPKNGLRGWKLPPKFPLKNRFFFNISKNNYIFLVKPTPKYFLKCRIAELCVQNLHAVWWKSPYGYSKLCNINAHKKINTLYGNYYPPHGEFELICIGKFARRTWVNFTQQYGKNRQRCQRNKFTMLYGNYCYIFIENFSRKFSPCAVRVNRFFSFFLSQ